MVKRFVVGCVAVGVLLVLASPAVLYAIKPRPYMDPSAPWFVLGPRCGDADDKRAPGCNGPGKWRVELLGKTHTKETWPTWPWDLL